MSEEASAGEEGRQGQPFIIRQGKADSKDSINIEVFTPPRSMEGSPPYDSERMPSRPNPQFSNYDTASEEGGLGRGEFAAPASSGFAMTFKETYNVCISMAFLLSMMMLFLPKATSAQEIKLLVRGDDFGMTQGSLVAFERAFNEGVLTCGSLLVQPPWFEGAADLYRKNPGWCIGVHLSLVGEWRGYSWRPVLPWDKVSSLVDEDGFLYKHPKNLFKRNPKIEEIDAELRAQINLARKKGVNVQYLDTHYMGLADYPGLSEVIKKIGRDYNLPLSSRMGEKRVRGIYRVPLKEKKAEALKMLENLAPGLWLWVCHIGIDSPEQNALVHSAPEDVFIDGGVGPHRAAELQVLTSLEVKSVILQKGIKLTNYRELAKNR